MSRRLDELFSPLGKEAPRIEIHGIAWDSRRVKPGDLFFALPGTKHDGHEFIPQAVEKGAAAVAGERPLQSLRVPYIQVEDSREAMARVAAAFFGYPTRKLTAIGVTGTDGKTTVVHILGQLLPECEILTTIRVEREGLSCVTTPEAPEIQRLAAEAVSRGRRFFVLEASSIGLAQKRLLGTEFRCAIFTNLSRDHLDFHKTLEAYLTAKLALFEMLPEEGIAVVNAESPYAERILSHTVARSISYGIATGDVKAEAIEERAWNLRFELITPEGRANVSLPFPGLFNLENALAAAAQAWALGFPLRRIAERLAGASLPAGRLERLRSRRGAWVVVDYAHTPRALEAVLQLLRPRARSLFVVFGAPGESDTGKRPLMGKTVGIYADLAIVTTDNPKTEDPAVIAAQIARGLEEVRAAYEIKLERKEAIRRALELAGPGDIVLVAGKGHERYQLIGTHKFPHSDVEQLLFLGCRAES